MGDTWKYIEGVLSRKEGSKWKEYWVVIHEKFMLFYLLPAKKTGTFVGTIELDSKTKCRALKKRAYSFQFYVTTLKARYLFKVPSNTVRHDWFTAIEYASKGRCPSSVGCFPDDSDNFSNICPKEFLANNNTPKVVANNKDEENTCDVKTEKEERVESDYESDNSEASDESNSVDDTPLTSNIIYVKQEKLNVLVVNDLKDAVSKEGYRVGSSTRSSSGIESDRARKSLVTRVCKPQVAKPGSATQRLTSPNYSGGSLFYNIPPSATKTQFSRYLVRPAS